MPSFCPLFARFSVSKSGLKFDVKFDVNFPDVSTSKVSVRQRRNVRRKTALRRNSTSAKLQNEPSFMAIVPEFVKIFIIKVR